MADTPRGLIIAAPGSGTGKTTVTMALIAALRARALTVGAAKTGPDYIDPRFHEAAAGRPCVNLDPWAMPPERLRARLAEAAGGCDIVLIEGVMGLFDGSEDGSGSTADLARMLDLPVVLVVDAGRQSRSIAALVHGFDSFAPGLELAGVIATRLGSERHRAMIVSALGEARPPCLGALPAMPGLTLESRHLGLVQAMEHGALVDLVTLAAEAAAAHIDLDRLIALARPIPFANAPAGLPPLGQRIAVAEDEAFAFLYPHMLTDWRRAGAEIRKFSPLANAPPDPDCDAVFLPGGYPELHAGRIAAATATLDGIRAHASGGHLIYGECGGYMVLGRALIDADGVSHEMLGLLGHVTSFAERTRTLGYRRLTHDGALPWPARLSGHEFHYSALAETGGEAPLFVAETSAGAALGTIGACDGRVMGSYAHVIDVAPGDGES